MTHASLFSDIGGFDLAAEWAGWTNAFNCEIDPFCRKILKYHFPDAEQYGDIKTADFAVWRDRIDVLTGGFPCQPFSLPASQVKRKSGLSKMAMQSDEYRTGTTSRLNPLYVIEMMGFPANWLVSPFLRGAGDPSKHAATP